MVEAFINLSFLRRFMKFFIVSTPGKIRWSHFATSFDNKIFTILGILTAPYSALTLKRFNNKIARRNTAPPVASIKHAADRTSCWPKTKEIFKESEYSCAGPSGQRSICPDLIFMFFLHKGKKNINKYVNDHFMEAF